jgi:hypothetical protein
MGDCVEVAAAVAAAADPADPGRLAPEAFRSIQRSLIVRVGAAALRFRLYVRKRTDERLN